MKAHVLKSYPESYDRLQEASPARCFEIRRNDRDFQAGDVLVINEWSPEKQGFTFNTAFREIVAIDDEAPDLDESCVVLELALLLERPMDSPQLQLCQSVYSAWLSEQSEAAAAASDPAKEREYLRRCRSLFEQGLCPEDCGVLDVVDNHNLHCPRCGATSFVAAGHGLGRRHTGHAPAGMYPFEPDERKKERT